MHINAKILKVAVFSAITCITNAQQQQQQQQQQPQTYNGTILQLLNDTSVSPSLKFSEFLYNSSDYQSIIQILNNTNQNVTFFLPSDQVYYEATGQTPPSANSSSSQTSSSSSAASTSASASGTTQAASRNTQSASSTGGTTTGAIGGFFSSLVGGQPSQPAATATNQAVVTTAHRRAVQTDAASPFEARFNPLAIARKDASWESVTTDSTFADQFSYLDIIYYHLVNGSVNLNDGNSSTLILNSLLKNQSVVQSGSSAPLVVQQNMTGSSQGQQQNNTQGNNSQNGSQNNNASGNWTVGSGLGEGAQINQTFQTSNGIVYVINKVLIPPVNASQTLTQLNDASFFTWLLSQANASLDSSSNFTVFAPSNQAIQNISLIQLNNQTLHNLVQAHIVPGTYYTSNVTSNQPVQIKSAGGNNITLSESKNNVTVNNNIHIIKPNVLMSNGVLHLIDGVLNYTVVASNSSNGGGSNSTTNNGGNNNGGGSSSTGSSNGGNNGGQSASQTSAGGAFPTPTNLATSHFAVTPVNLVLSSVFVYLSFQFF